jgi:hypothetical protein
MSPGGNARGRFNPPMMKRLFGFWTRRKRPKIYNVFLGRKQTLDEYLAWKRARKGNPDHRNGSDFSGPSAET